MININDVESSKEPEDFYISLKEKLSAHHNFPEDYLFKFILLNDESKLTEIYRIFDGVKFTMTSRDSKNGKYTSINMKAFMLDADHVIGIYKEVGALEGVMML